MRSNLRFRILSAFALFSLLVTLLLVAFIFVSYEAGKEGAAQKIFTAEVQAFISRAEADPGVPLPSIPLTEIYEGEAEMPAQLRDRLPLFEPEDYDIPLSEWNEIQLYTWQRPDGTNVYFFFTLGRTEDSILFSPNLRRVLFVFIPLFLAFTIWTGWLISRRLSRPLDELTRRIRDHDPDAPPNGIAADFLDGELGELAAAFEQQQKRIVDFIDRERRFTRHASHELRTPLTVAGGASENLFRRIEGLDPKSRRAVGILRQSMEEMQATVDALLWLSREHPVPDRNASCPSAEIVERCIELHRPLTDGRPVDVREDIQCREHGGIPADLFRIVASNLIRNAFQYTPSGRIDILLGERELAVENPGGGIPEEVARQLDAEKIRGVQVKGTGIGLSLVTRIADRCGWKVTFTTPQEGRFRVSVELK